MNSALWGQVSCVILDGLGWFQLQPKEQWDIGLKLLGGFGAVAVFIWSVRQWFESRKIEFEIAILERLRTLHEGWTKASHAWRKNTTDSDFKKYYEYARKIMQKLEIESRLIAESEMGFKQLRRLNKRYVGVDAWLMEEAIEQDAKHRWETIRSFIESEALAKSLKKFATKHIGTNHN